MDAMFDLRTLTEGASDLIKAWKGFCALQFPKSVSISIIDVGLVISGQISGRGDIFLYGRIEGAVTCRRLFLGGDSYLKGPIEVEALVKLSSD